MILPRVTNLISTQMDNYLANAVKALANKIKTLGKDIRITKPIVTISFSFRLKVTSIGCLCCRVGCSY